VQPGGQGIFNAAAIKQEFPKKTIIIAALYFRGLQPDCCYLGTYADRFQTPSLYHSVMVLDAFLQGKNEKHALQSLTMENFERLGLVSAWENSVDEMRRRDEALDIPAAEIVETYCLEFCGFHSVNHPTLAMLHHYISIVLRHLGIAFRLMDLAAAKDPLVSQDIFPLHDFVAEFYELPYRTSQHWMIYHLGKKYLDREEYIRRCFAAYNKVDPKKLIVHSPEDLRRSLQTNPKLKHLWVE
jgi:hypothetical protein